METGESKITGYFAERSGLSASDFPIGIGDDMAQMAVGSVGSLLITTDMLLDGSHFDSACHSLEQIGYKSMAASLSDCAAMATVPFAAVVSVGLPAGFSEAALKSLHSGLLRAGEMFDCKLIGGDITSWRNEQGKLAVSVALVSKPGATAPIKRSGAKVGDIICVTGSLGASIQGKHISFTPRVKEALEISRLAAPTAMMDISDGLSTDLSHLCRSSGVGAVVYEKFIPVSQAAKEAENPLEAALNDGEDFELLFTVSKDRFQTLKKNWTMDTAITVVGEITTGGLKIVYGNGTEAELKPGGFDHIGG